MTSKLFVTIGVVLGIAFGAYKVTRPAPPISEVAKVAQTPPVAATESSSWFSWFPKPSIPSFSLPTPSFGAVVEFIVVGGAIICGSIGGIVMGDGIGSIAATGAVTPSEGAFESPIGCFVFVIGILMAAYYIVTRLLLGWDIPHVINLFFGTQ